MIIEKKGMRVHTKCAFVGEVEFREKQGWRMLMMIDGDNNDDDEGEETLL